MGGVAKLGELLCEITSEIDPSLQFLPGSVWSQGWSVTEGQLRTAVVFVYLFHTTKLLKINELCKFFFDFLYTETRRHRGIFFHSCWPNHPFPLLQKEGEGVVKQAVLRARGG